MLRALAVVCVLAALAAACSKSGTSGEESSADHGGGEPAPPTSASTTPRELIRAAGLCENRGRCPPLDELEARARGREHATVKQAALETMLDASVAHGSLEARAALTSLGAWLQLQGPTLSKPDRDAFIVDVTQILDKGDAGYRAPLYGHLLSTPLAMTGVAEFLVAEIENPARSDDDVRVLAERLADHQDDLALATRWIRSGDWRLVRAAVRMMKYIDQVRIQKSAEDQALLVEAATLDHLPADVALDVVESIETYGVPNLAPALAAMEKHPDATVAARARSIQLAN